MVLAAAVDVVQLPAIPGEDVAPGGCRRPEVTWAVCGGYDGSLDGIIDTFSGSKVITLQLAVGSRSDGLERFGEILTIELPKVRFKCPRKDVSKSLSEILQQYTVEDVAVEDPPLEEVIAGLFRSVSVP